MRGTDVTRPSRFVEQLRPLPRPLVVKVLGVSENVPGVCVTRPFPAQVVEDTSGVNSELSVVGATCRGERHEQVIHRQREALTELRARMRDFDPAKSSMYNASL